MIYSDVLPLAWYCDYGKILEASVVHTHRKQIQLNNSEGHSFANKQTQRHSLFCDLVKLLSGMAAKYRT